MGAPEIWTISDIAEWLKYSRRHVAERLIFERGFPPPIRDGKGVQRYVQALRQLVSRPWTIMEVCGGQTHSIVKFG